MIRETAMTAPVPDKEECLQGTPYLSLVIPVYNEHENLEALYGEIVEALEPLGIEYEVVFVDDGSSDDSHAIMQRLSRLDGRVVVICLRRNFGKAMAYTIGFRAAHGDTIVTLDADRQDDPHEIPRLLAKMNEGYEVVAGWRRTRRDRHFKNASSWFYNTMTSVVSGVRLHDFNTGLKAYSRDAAKSMVLYGQLHRYMPVLAQANGFRVSEVPVNHRPRVAGKSKYGPRRYLEGFLDLATILLLTRFARNPLHFFGSIGFLAFLAGFLVDAYVVTDKVFYGIGISTRPILLLGVLLMVMGVQLVAIGLVGEIVIYHSNRHREQADHAVRIVKS